MTREERIGELLLARLAGTTLDARAKSAARAFRAEQQALAAATRAAGDRDHDRARALDAVGRADEALDAAISALADRLIGAGLGKRGRPFAGLSAKSPSELADLAYAAELAEAGKVLRAVRAKKPPAEVAAACDAVDDAIAEVRAALVAHDRARAASAGAAAERDARLEGWQKALTRLRILARAALVDEPGAYEALVALPPELLGGRARRRKAPAAPPTDPVG